jgi:recombination protein RecA
MAQKKKDKEEIFTSSQDDIAGSLMDALNKEFGMRIAYNLSDGDSPTHVKRWISTGSKLLDFVCSNRAEGGLPEGRIIELYGEPSTGKSHVAYSTIKTVQSMGGLAVYIDSEVATSPDKLVEMGIDLKKFVYCAAHETEEVFKIAESTINKAKQIIDKNVPILIVWDSVAATSPKMEMDGDYDANTVGLQARVISKGMRKITGVIGHNNVTFLALNQTRTRIGGNLYSDPTVVPGGKSIPFHASIRIGLTAGGKIKDGSGTVVGTNVHATIHKNKLAPAHRRIDFSIVFGKGIVETDSIFEILAAKKDGIVVDGKVHTISGSTWRTLTIKDEKTDQIISEKKFQKSGFDELMKTSDYGPILDKMLESVMILKGGEPVDGQAETYTDEE